MTMMKTLNPLAREFVPLPSAEKSWNDWWYEHQGDYPPPPPPPFCNHPMILMVPFPPPKYEMFSPLDLAKVPPMESVSKKEELPKEEVEPPKEEEVESTLEEEPPKEEPPKEESLEKEEEEPKEEEVESTLEEESPKEEEQKEEVAKEEVAKKKSKTAKKNRANRERKKRQKQKEENKNHDEKLAELLPGVCNLEIMSGGQVLARNYEAKKDRKRLRHMYRLMVLQTIVSDILNSLCGYVKHQSTYTEYQTSSVLFNHMWHLFVTSTDVSGVYTHMFYLMVRMIRTQAYTIEGVNLRHEEAAKVLPVHHKLNMMLDLIIESMDEILSEHWCMVGDVSVIRTKYLSKCRDCLHRKVPCERWLCCFIESQYIEKKIISCDVVVV